MGPSSSHTMGPRKAAEIFLRKHPEATAFEVDADSMRPHRTRVVSEESREENDPQKVDYSTMTTSELEKIMLKFSDAEQYEMAAQIKSIIVSRKSEKHDC